MNYFLNFKNGQASVDTYRFPDAAATDIADIISAKDAGSEETLTASLDIFINEEASKIMSIAKTCENQEELWDYVLGEGDFLELLLERELGIQLSDYPDLRDLQKQQFEHILESF